MFHRLAIFHRLLLFVGALALASALLPIPALADKKEDEKAANSRTLRGVVSDGGGNPLQGAIVQLKDTKSLQVRSFITPVNGEYLFNGLNPGIDYEVVAKFQESESPKRVLSTFDSRKRVSLDLTIKTDK